MKQELQLQKEHNNDVDLWKSNLFLSVDKSKDQFTKEFNDVINQHKQQQQHFITIPDEQSIDVSREFKLLHQLPLDLSAHLFDQLFKCKRTILTKQSSQLIQSSIQSSILNNNTNTSPTLSVKDNNKTIKNNSNNNNNNNVITSTRKKILQFKEEENEISEEEYFSCEEDEDDDDRIPTVDIVLDVLNTSQLENKHST